jgi:CheY-like chemotaxis protein
VTCVVDRAAILAEIDGRSPEVLLLDWALPASDQGTLVREIRSRQGHPHLYIIATMPHAPQARAAEAYKAAVDDVMYKGADRDELLGRVEAPARIRCWSQSPGSTALDFGEIYDVSRLRVWKDLEGMLSSEVGGMLGQRLRAGRIGTVSAVMHAAEIALSLPAEKLEVRITVGTDKVSGKALSRLLLGADYDPTALADILREVANTAAGAFKRAALVDGVSFTIGLPVNRPPFEVGAPRSLAWAAKSDDGFGIRFLVTPFHRGPQRLYARELAEGQVLVHDVKCPAGVVLMAAGTALSQRTIERLQILVRPDRLLDVVDPNGSVDWGQGLGSSASR